MEGYGCLAAKWQVHFIPRKRCEETAPPYCWFEHGVGKEINLSCPFSLDSKGTHNNLVLSKTPLKCDFGLASSCTEELMIAVLVTFYSRDNHFRKHLLKIKVWVHGFRGLSLVIFGSTALCLGCDSKHVGQLLTSPWGGQDTKQPCCRSHARSSSLS